MIRITRSTVPAEVPVVDLLVGVPFLISTQPDSVYVRGKVNPHNNRVDVMKFTEGTTRAVWTVLDVNTKVVSLVDYDLTLSFTKTTTFEDPFRS